MKQLPVLTETELARTSLAAKQSPMRSVALFALRVGLLIVAICGLHQASQLGLARARLLQREAPSLAAVQQLAPAAASLEVVQLGVVKQNASLGYRVFDSAGASLGTVITTSPEADSIVGYSGANDVLLLLDDQQRVFAAALLRSGDTAEHAAQVIGDEAFWLQFNGLTMGEPTELEVDGVSGATLTSLAIAEGIQLRMSGRKLSLRFPDSITLAEVQEYVPQVSALGGESSGLLTLKGPDGELLGWVARTGEVVDAEEGYQGPTELLLMFEPSGVLTQVRIRKSYDNEPYVGYVKQEYSFWSRFKGRNLSELAELDIEKEGIEGVSGATMTSLAVARTIAEAMQQWQASRGPNAAQSTDREAGSATLRRPWNWSLSELATACLVGASLIWSRSKWRGRTLPRLIWQSVCLVVIGLWTGNLISLALIAGWTGSGVPYHLAPGLCVLLAVAFFWPAISKQNVYCDHLCPHGVLQQWIARWRGVNSKRRERGAPGSAILIRVLAVTPWVAFVAAVSWLIFQLPVRLAWLEPFDAYSWRIGLSLSALVWGVSLALAAWKPMIYCRLLCPTGKAIDFVRRGKRVRIGWGDAAVLAVAAAAWWRVGLG